MSIQIPFSIPDVSELAGQLTRNPIESLSFIMYAILTIGSGILSAQKSEISMVGIIAGLGLTAIGIISGQELAINAGVAVAIGSGIGGIRHLRVPNNNKRKY